MSEQDNLQEADGKTEEFSNENSITKEENTVTDQAENTDNQEHQEEIINKTEASNIDDTEEQSTEKTDTEEHSDHAISEIDASNAEDAEDEGTSERHEIEVKDYHSMSLEDLVSELNKLVKYEKVQAIKSHVESIRSEFKTKFNALLDEKKEEFLSEGGNVIDFHYSSPIQKDFKDTYNSYRDKIKSHYKRLRKVIKII